MRRGRVLLCALLLLSLPVRLRCDWASPASGEPSACGATFASGAAPAQLSAATQDTVTLLLARAAAYRELKSASGWARSLPYAWAAAQLAPYVRDSPLTWAHQARFAAELGFSLAALHSGQEAQARRSAAVLARMLAEEPTLRRSSARVARSSAQQLLLVAQARGWGDWTASGREWDPVWARLRQALDTEEPACSHTRVLLPPSLGSASPGVGDCGGGPLGDALDELVVLSLPSRQAHAHAFVTSLRCRAYTRFDAVTRPVPSELVPPASVEEDEALSVGATRLYTAYARCLLPYVASRPPSTRVAIFEDDVTPIAHADLPALAASARRLMALGNQETQAGSQRGALHLLGSCFLILISGEAMSEDGALVRLSRSSSFRCTHAFALRPTGAAAALRGLGMRDHRGNATSSGLVVVDTAIDAALSGLVQAGQLEAYAHFPSLFTQADAFRTDSLNAHPWSADMGSGASTPPIELPVTPVAEPSRSGAQCSSAEPLTVTPHLTAGLGNQLFMMAHACWVAQGLGGGAVCGVYERAVDRSVHAPPGAPSYAATLFSGFPAVRSPPTALYSEPVFASNLHLPVRHALAPGTRHLHCVGYFQHEAYIPAGFAHSLRLPRHAPLQRTAFVHVRRGDYVASARYDLRLDGSPTGYYGRAMELLRQRFNVNDEGGGGGGGGGGGAPQPPLRFLVFSDDPEWARSQPVFAHPDVRFYAPQPNQTEQHALAAMAACECGGVAANSSFSWWAGYLNTNPEKRVIFPELWYADADSLVSDTPFHGSWLVSLSGGGEGGEGSRVDRELQATRHGKGEHADAVERMMMATEGE